MRQVLRTSIWSGGHRTAEMNMMKMRFFFYVEIYYIYIYIYYECVYVYICELCMER